LKAQGIKKGDRSDLPAHDSRARHCHAGLQPGIGAIHSIVFGGFSSDSLRDRIEDSPSKILVTCGRDLPRRQGRSPEGQRRRRYQGI